MFYARLSGKLGFVRDAIMCYKYSMEGDNSLSIKAVAFDLDGTLYPNYRLYVRLFPHLMRHFFFYGAFLKARRRLHSVQSAHSEQVSSFYDRQASVMAELLGKTADQTKLKLERLVYRGWEKYFSGIKIFPRLKETLLALKGSGFRLAVLSDLPPARKLSLLGLEGFFDVILSSEETGALKPSGVPFNVLSHSLNLEPGKILYVGNSLYFDVEGAKSAGMKAALIRKGVFSTGHIPGSGIDAADFVFRDYRQLQEYILK